MHEIEDGHKVVGGEYRYWWWCLPCKVGELDHESSLDAWRASEAHRNEEPKL